MKILHFSWEFPPVMFGGLGEHVVELTREQARQGHDVVVITQQSEPASLKDEVVSGVRVIRVDNAYPSVRFSSQSLDQWAYGFALASFQAAEGLMEEWKPDIAHAHDWLATMQAQLVTDRYDIPHVITFHATEFGRHQGWLASRVSKVIFAREVNASRRAIRMIVCSTFMQGELAMGLGANRTNIRIVPNGVNRASIGTSKQVPQGKSPIVIGFLGRLEWEKGAHHVIDSLKYLPAQSPTDAGFRVEIIGSGSQFPSLQEKVTRNGLSERVIFHGFVSAQEKQDLLNNFDVLVIPSSYEPFGIVALEGAALGIPLIIADSGGLTDIVPDDSYGYQLTEISGAEIARKVMHILQSPDDAAKRSTNLLQRLDAEFTWDAIAESTERVYREAQTLGAR